MTTPTLLTKETIGPQTFTVHRALFVAPRGGCGVRILHRIDGKRVKRETWDSQRSAALNQAEGRPPMTATSAIKAAGYIVCDSESVIHGSGETVDLAWADADYNLHCAGITLLEDDDDSDCQQGAWTRRSGFRVHAASSALLAQVAEAGGAKRWELVGGMAVTSQEA